MSRITPPVTKFSHVIRSVSSSAPRTAFISASGSESLPRNPSELQTESSRRQVNNYGSKPQLRDFHTGAHRPSLPSSHHQSLKPIPLMQGFRTSAPVAAAHDTSSIDFMFFPSLSSSSASDSNTLAIRVPLLPDNYTPDRSASSAHALEIPDAAVPRLEIHVVSQAAETVAALSEMVGNEALDVHVSQWTSGFEEKGREEEGASNGGTIRQFWGGLVDDLFGAKGGRMAL